MGENFFVKFYVGAAVNNSNAIFDLKKVLNVFFYCATMSAFINYGKDLHGTFSENCR